MTDHAFDDDRMDIVGRNGNDGLHYGDEPEGPADAAFDELQSTWDIADISPRALFAAGYRQGARDAQSGAEKPSERTDSPRAVEPSDA
jgi:hypothetical protein